MGLFEFKTNEKSENYCLRIVDKMIENFNISKEEAFGRINNHWRNSEFPLYELLFHEGVDYWSKSIYYGDIHWWSEDEELIPVPYP